MTSTGEPAPALTTETDTPLGPTRPTADGFTTVTPGSLHSVQRTTSPAPPTHSPTAQPHGHQCTNTFALADDGMASTGSEASTPRANSPILLTAPLPEDAVEGDPTDATADGTADSSSTEGTATDAKPRAPTPTPDMIAYVSPGPADGRGRTRG